MLASPGHKRRRLGSGINPRRPLVHHLTGIVLEIHNLFARLVMFTEQACSGSVGVDGSIMPSIAAAYLCRLVRHDSVVLGVDSCSGNPLAPLFHVTLKAFIAAPLGPG